MDKIGVFGAAIDDYAKEHGLSSTQSAILRFHFAGRHTKEVADLLDVAPATVHEHWRRMARKLGCLTRGEVLANVYRFLAAHFETAPEQTPEQTFGSMTSDIEGHDSTRE
jgi:DNA-binding CsgD family transcriptional regulator